MVLQKLSPVTSNSEPLHFTEEPDPEPGTGEVRLRVSACGVCHTELDEIEGRTPPRRLPMIPGHEVIGVVDQLGAGASQFELGNRVGVGWIHCSTGRSDENLDASFVATGRDVNGGYAEYMTVPEAYAYPIPTRLSDEQAAPLMCAGAVGYRSLKLTGMENKDRLGLMGFGGCAHLVLQIVQHLYPDTEVYVFAREEESRKFAISLGATWAGNVYDASPLRLDAVIDTTPAWKPVIYSLQNLRPGGRLVINAIRKEDNDKNQLVNIGYEKHLWMEKEIKTVANVTHFDIQEFLPLAASAGIEPTIELYSLQQANKALRELKAGNIRGAKVLMI